MNQEKKPDFVMTEDGELVPTDEIRSADLPEPKQKAKLELPAFPKSPPPAPKAKVPPPAPAPAAAAPVPISTPKRPPPPLPPLDPREMVEPKVWTGERTQPDRSTASSALAELAQMAAAEEQYAEIEPIGVISAPPLADDLSLPSPAPFEQPRAWDESLSSNAEVEALLRDQKYRAVMEQVADIDGDESLEEAQAAPPPPPPPAPPPTASQDVPVIRGTAVTPPPPRSNVMRPSITGAGAPEDPAPRRGPPRVPLHRVIKEKNRNR